MAFFPDFDSSNNKQSSAPNVPRRVRPGRQIARSMGPAAGSPSSPRWPSPPLSHSGPKPRPVLVIQSFISDENTPTHTTTRSLGYLLILGVLLPRPSGHPLAVSEVLLMRLLVLSVGQTVTQCPVIGITAAASKVGTNALLAVLKVPMEVVLAPCSLATTAAHVFV